MILSATIYLNMKDMLTICWRGGGGGLLRCAGDARGQQHVEEGGDALSCQRSPESQCPRNTVTR